MSPRPLAVRRPSLSVSPPAAAGGAAAAAASTAGLPLVVDADRALCASPPWQEALARVASLAPAALPRVLAAGLGGRGALERAAIDAAGPADDAALRPDAADAVAAARAAGRPVFLAGAGDPRRTAALARRLGADGVVEVRPGDGAASAAAAVFGAGAFDLLAAHPGGTLPAGPRTLRIARNDRPPAAAARAAVRALRPHQWAKNLLVFLPLVLAHAFDPAAIAAALVAFAAFSLAASSAYCLNDLLDLSADRASPAKRRRPFAAGDLSIATGAGMALVLAAAAALAASVLPSGFLVLLGVYAATTVAYSTVLKRRLLLDVVALAGLYALRVLAGGAAAGVAVSDWLLMFGVFLFLALALLKRFAELAEREREGRPPPAGRPYRFEDMRLLLPLAAAAGYLSVLVVALYLEADRVRTLYAAPEILKLALLVQIYWVSRVLLIANRGDLHEDPVVFALRDRTSWLCAAVVAGLMLAAA